MTTYSVNLYRFTDDPAAMIAFYQALGLRTRVTSGDGRFALLQAGAGWVAVHPAEGSDTGATPGETQLVFLVEDGDAAAAASDLQSKGLQTRVWDESYGRHAVVRTPLGSNVWINEHQDDLYGYRAHPEGQPGPIQVCAIHFSADFARDAAWFAHLGLRPVGEGDAWWQALDGGHGRVGLHHVDPGHPECTAETATVDAGFETPEPLADVVARLWAAGYPAELVTDEFLTAVHVADPDGRLVQVHALS